MLIVAYIIMAFGAILLLLGVLLLKKGHYEKKGHLDGRNKIKIFNLEFDLSHPSLVIFVVGFIIFVLPILYKDHFILLYNSGKIPQEKELLDSNYHKETEKKVKLQKILNDIENAYKNRDISLASKVFLDSSCEAFLENLWDQPRAPSEIRLNIIQKDNYDYVDNEVDIDVDFAGKEFGEWKSYGVKKAKVLLIGDDLKLKRCSFLE